MAKWRQYAPSGAVMLAVYLFLLVVGGGVLGVSLAGGGHGHGLGGGGHDVHLGGHAGLGQLGDGHAVDHAGHAPGHTPPADAALAVVGPRALAKHKPKPPGIVTSLRFWTFASAFGGMTGAAIHLLGLAGEPVTGLCALGLGLAAGTGAGLTQRVLGNEEVTSMATRDAYVGAEGVVIVPVAKGDPGKIRLQIKDVSVDLKAVTDETEAFPLRASALVLDVDDQGVARIVHGP